MQNSNTSVAPRKVGRRGFIGGTAAALMVPFAITLGGRTAQAVVPGSGIVGAYVKIDSSNIVTVVLGSTEMGQGILTGLAQLVAEELNLNWDQVRAEHAPASTASPNPYGNPLFGAQLTGGSTSTRGWYAPLRMAAAIARETLIAAANKKFGGTWSLGQGGTLVNGGQTANFADVVKVAARMKPPTSATLATTTRFIGKRMNRLDIPAKVDGSAVFGIDVQVPGMKFGAVCHCPTIGGTVKTMPAGRSGVTLVNLGKAVGVIADDTWTAMQVARSITNSVIWTLPTDLDAVDSTALAANAKALTESTTVATFVAVDVGSPKIGAKQKSIDVTYELPFLAHATMEVMNCTASVTADSVEIWVPTQGQQFITGLASTLTGVPAANITVHTTFLGGGLGRKFETDYVAQAINMSKAAGVPVKLTWSREQDFGNDFYRPYAQIRVKAALNNKGKLSDLIYRNVSASINVQRGYSSSNNPEDTGALSGAVDLPYTIPSRRVEFIPLVPCDIPLGYWRSVGESYNTFAVECAIDEMATLAGADPLQFRKDMLSGPNGNTRAMGVLKAVEKLSNWSSPPGNGTARGVAFMSGFGSYIAMVAEVSKSSSGKLTIGKMFCAIDCGVAVNPGSIEAQIQGGITHGMSATLWGQMTFIKGKPQTQNFNTYPMLKLGQMPTIGIKIVNSDAAPGGVGETGVPCVAPSIANAWAKLTGNRQRSLPFYPGTRMGEM
ncbi:MAG: molybdopterin cofactor-binding domain-containing protein [bacterium]